MEQRLYTVEEAAERLRLSRTAVFALIADSRLGSVKIGQRRRIPAQAIDAFVAELCAGAS